MILLHTLFCHYCCFSTYFKILTQSMTNCQLMIQSIAQIQKFLNSFPPLISMQCAYRCAWCYLQQLHSSWRELLGVIPTSPIAVSKKQKRERQSSDEANKWGGVEEGENMDTEEQDELSCNQRAEKQLESAITVYLRRVCSQQDITPMTKVYYINTTKIVLISESFVLDAVVSTR